MAKAGRGSEQVMIRLPDGMRDRIKGTAEKRGRSMNAEIVRALELAFPEPLSLADRLDDLLHLLGAFKTVKGYDGAVEPLTDAILETVEGIAAGRVPDLDEESVDRVRSHLTKWRRKREVREKHRIEATEGRYKPGSEDS